MLLLRETRKSFAVENAEIAEFFLEVFSACPVRSVVKKVLGLFQLGDWRKKKNAPCKGRVFLLASHLAV